MNNVNLKYATFGGGCFWCTEAIFQNVIGVKLVESGYSGGHVPGHPTYREICSGLTGHAEVIQITFDETEVSFEELLTIFMMTHDPTTLNKQGADVGTQYRSVIFYHDQDQKKIAERVLTEAARYYDKKIVTEITALQAFYKAEEYHQNYFNNNKEQPYCSMVIMPKLSKFKKSFADKFK